jgi:hypothetical protein
VTAFDKAGICMKSVGKTAVGTSQESNQMHLEFNAGTMPTEALILCFSLFVTIKYVGNRVYSFFSPNIIISKL